MNNLKQSRNIFFLVVMLLIFFIACSNQENWYPQGKAKVENMFEIVETQKQCLCTISIENIGKSKINQSTISLQVTTTEHSYYHTIVSSIGIVSGGKIYTTISIPYIDLAEETTIQKIIILDEFYE